MTNLVSQLTEDQTRLILESIDLAKIIVPALCTLLAAIFGARYAYLFGNRQFKEEKRLSFLRQQIEDFYSPIVGCIKRIRASSELRVELSSGSNVAWRKICEENPKPFLEHEKHFEPFKKQIEDENKRFPEHLLPLYDEMLEIFTRKYWLAEESTRVFYQPFSRYVELWHRVYDNSIPARVLQEVPIEEESLLPFYEELDSQLGRLRTELSQK